MAKKIFAISTLALVLLIGAIFVYNFAFKKSTPAATQTAKTATEGKTGDSTPAKQPATTDAGAAISAISDGPVFGAVLSADQNFIDYFSGANGQVDQVSFDGKLHKVLSTEEFQSIQTITWNKPRNKAIIRKNIGAGKSKFLLLDIDQKTVTPLKDNIDSVSWSGLGDKIIYKYFDASTKKRTLNVADPNGANWHKIADVSYFGVEISPVPGSSDISFWPTPDAFTSSSANLVSFNGENKKEILAGRYGADLLWSPDGKSAAVSYTDQKGGKKTDLAVMNSAGGELHSLNFQTFARKCTWSADSKFLYCGLPGGMSESAILPNDWRDGKIQPADTFWKIEVATGKKDRLIDTAKIGASYDILNPFLSQDGKTMFFTNKADGKLYKLEL